MHFTDSRRTLNIPKYEEYRTPKIPEVYRQYSRVSDTQTRKAQGVFRGVKPRNTPSMEYLPEAQNATSIRNTSSVSSPRYIAVPPPYTGSMRGSLHQLPLWGRSRVHALVSVKNCGDLCRNSRLFPRSHSDQETFQAQHPLCESRLSCKRAEVVIFMVSAATYEQ